MKVGLSYSRCVRDIVDGVVDINDVLVVIARTDFDPHNDDQWKGIWGGYHYNNPEWASYPDEAEAEFREVSIKLYDSGKMHQPRKFGARPNRLSYYWIEAGLQTSDIESNPAVKKAWEQFQIIAGLANTNTIKDNF